MLLERTMWATGKLQAAARVDDDCIKDAVNFSRITWEVQQNSYS